MIKIYVVPGSFWLHNYGDVTMTSKKWPLGAAFVLSWLVAASALAADAAPPVAPAAAPAAAQAPNFASDDDRLDGDHLRFRVNAAGFKELTNGTTPKCVPQASVAVVSRVEGENVYLRFQAISKKADRATDDAAYAVCEAFGLASEGVQYSISKSELYKYDFKRSGVTFGALVVPFKFYLGGDRKISSSSTVAPYIGFLGPELFGLTFTPVASAGLGLVPIANAASGVADSKAAFSTAFGLRLTSSKNEAFSAGLVIGKDFLSKADRAADPTVGKAWLSVYLGYSL